MECQDVRERLLDHQRGRLSGDVQAQLVAHLAECAGCRRAADAESGLSRLLEQQLPRHAAPAALKQRLAERSAASAARPTRSGRLRRWAAPLASALAAAALVLLVVRATQPAFLRSSSPLPADLVEEGVNDHLRVVTSLHPVEIESGGIHQVKPWFTGRLDFAPRVSFSGDDQFKLEGGNVGYFRDRKAAIFVFKVRLHTISLFVFRAEGLPWPTRGLERVGPLAVDARGARGFNVLLWRDGELGYCLVSDVGRADLDALAVRIATAGP
ncbi:MAG: zf-HC2 domain-containing protein [Polyangia bacterium]